MSGTVRTVPKDEYHSDDLLSGKPTLSASIASILCTSSPAHARAAHPRLNPDFVHVDEQKFDVGSSAHALLLEGVDAVEVVDAADWRTAAAKEARDAARDAGRIPLLAKDWDAVKQMVASVREQLGLLDCDPALLTDGKPEQTLVWYDHGVACRARLDWLRDDLAAIDDLKTTRASANPDTWSRTMFSIGADIQAAFYKRGVQAVFGVDADFRFIVVENYPPFALSVCSLAPDALALADEKVAYALETWARCLDSGVWPAYPLRVCHIEMPTWAESQWMARELRGEAA